MTPQVVIVGAGPAGLTAARVLTEARLDGVLVLERASEPGGLPRFCGHPGWGLTDLHRFWRGPRYAAALARRAARAELRTGTSVIAVGPDGTVSCNTPRGEATIETRAVLLATGIRETPRGGRGVSGARPFGVMTTGAFQETVYAGGMVPCRQPVIAGSELVAFSALLTARHAGIRPVAMIEPGSRTIARHPAASVARALFGVPVLTGTRLVEILGAESVDGVVVERQGRTRRLDCDGVIFTGQFRPEAALARASGFAIDPGTGGPAIDNFLRCAGRVFAAGNLLRPVEHSGFAAREGALAAGHILTLLQSGLPTPEDATRIVPDGAMRYVYPQRAIPQDGTVRITGRASRAHRGRLRALAGGTVLLDRRIDVLPERRIVMHLPGAALRRHESCRIVLD